MLLAGSAHRLCRRLYGSNDNVVHPRRYQKAQIACRQRNSSLAARTSLLVAGWQPIVRVPRQVTVKVAKPRSQASGDSNDADSSSSSGGVSPSEASQTPPTAGNSSTAADSTLAPDLPANASSVAAEANDTSSVRASDASAVATTSAGGTGAAENSGTPTAASVTGGGGGGGVREGPGVGGGAAPSTVALMTRFNGIGYTFVLAGFLKIVTLGGLVMSAPVDTARTAFGKSSPYLMVPVALGLCWVAKQVVDTGLHENRRFMQYMVATLVLLYFALVKLMYKYEPDSEWVRRPRPRLPGQLADLRAQLGDKDLIAGAGVNDSRSYMLEKPGKELYDDVAWYEGRYPSQINAAAAAAAEGPRRGRGSAVARLDARRAVAAASETDDEYGSASGVTDLMSTRDRGSAADADTNGTAVPVARVGNRRSFLSDNTR